MNTTNPSSESLMQALADYVDWSKVGGRDEEAVVDMIIDRARRLDAARTPASPTPSAVTAGDDPVRALVLKLRVLASAIGAPVQTRRNRSDEVRWSQQADYIADELEVALAKQSQPADVGTGDKP